MAYQGARPKDVTDNVVYVNGLPFYSKDGLVEVGNEMVFGEVQVAYSVALHNDPPIVDSRPLRHGPKQGRNGIPLRRGKGRG